MSGYTVRTLALLAVLIALFTLIGYGLFGLLGLLVFGGVAVAANLFSYWFSDRLVRRATGAEEISSDQALGLHWLVERAAQDIGVPKPKVYAVATPVPNAFATGRSPRRAAVIVTTGLVAALDERELAAVLAHELAHIANRDTLWGAMIATACSAVLLTMLPFLLLGKATRAILNFLTAKEKEEVTYLVEDADSGEVMLVAREEEKSRGLLGLLLAIVLRLCGWCVFAAMWLLYKLVDLLVTLLQMAASRQREYAADETASRTSGDPGALASALVKIQLASASPELAPVVAELSSNKAANHLYIFNPVRGRLAGLFSTHPSTESRVRRIRAIATNHPPR